MKPTSISGIVAVNPVFAGGRMIAYLQSMGEKDVAKVSFSLLGHVTSTIEIEVK